MNIRLIIELTKRDFIERYSGSILGVSWSFIWPLVNISIYTIIFSKIMGAKLPGAKNIYSYGVYLVAGLLPWMAFSNTILRSATVFIDKKYLITKIKLSLARLPLYIVCSETITFLISMLIYFIFLFLVKIPITKVVIVLPFIYLSQQIFAYALGFLLAIFNVFIRDIKEIVGIVLQIWFWFTPIVYVPSILPHFAQKILLFNPAYDYITVYQNIFVFGKIINFNRIILITIIAHLLLLVSFVIYKKLEKDIRDFL